MPTLDLPGPRVASPGRLRYGFERWFAYRGRLVDADGSEVGARAADSRFAERRFEVGGVRLGARHPRRGWRKRAVAIDPRDGAELVSFGRRDASAAGLELEWARPWRFGRRPWRLGLGGEELAVFQPHLFSLHRRVEVELVAASPLPVLLILVACDEVVQAQAENAPSGSVG